MTWVFSSDNIVQINTNFETTDLSPDHLAAGSKQLICVLGRAEALWRVLGRADLAHQFFSQ